MTQSRVADKPVETLVGGHGEKADDARGGVRPIVTVSHPATGSRRPLCICPVRPPAMELRPRLQHVLAGQSFPAHRWELIAAAEMYGADLVTRSELPGFLPVRFPCLADVLLAGWNAPAASRPPSTTSFLMPGRMTCAPARAPRRDLPLDSDPLTLTVNDGSFATSAASCTPADAAVVLDGPSVLGLPTRCF